MPQSSTEGIFVRDRNLLQKRLMSQDTMLAKVDDALVNSERPEPAYTLILGAGASFGVVPTGKEMLGLQDERTKLVHERAIPVWLTSERGTHLRPEDRLQHCKEFWTRFRRDNPTTETLLKLEEGLPQRDSVADAYKAVFDTRYVGGLDSPERHRRYLRAVTLDGTGATRLNATHFYLASLLSLQRRGGEKGLRGKPLYRGRREFVRTIFTTNFDPLLQTSLQLFQLLYYMTDRPEYLAPDALQTDHHSAIHLFYAHGSVHRPFLANTDEQINLLKNQNAHALTAYLADHGVIVLGYNGWDDCLLQALKQTRTFSNNLYWLARSSDSLSDGVCEFLTSHPNAYWIQIEDGGRFMAELHGRLCPGAPNTELLYNPVRAAMRQLQSVNLSGIRSIAADRDELAAQSIFVDGNKDVQSGQAPRQMGVASGAPRDVEQVRLQVLALLSAAEKPFIGSDEQIDVEELEQQAALSYANDDWDAALAAYERLLTRNLPPDRKALALFRRGYCLGQKGDASRELAAYNDVINLPGAPSEQVARALLNRGHVLGQAGDTDEAIADFSAVIQMPDISTETLASARFSRALAWGKKNEPEKEIADYSAIIETPGVLSELLAASLFNRGITWAQKEEYDKEIADYNVLLEIPDLRAEQLAEVRINRGLAWSKKGELGRAITDYIAAIATPGAPTEQLVRARLNLGLARHQEDDLDGAIHEYAQVIQMPGAGSEEIANARLHYGLASDRKGNTTEAIANYGATLEVPGVPAELLARAQLQRGLAHQKMGDLRSARFDLDAVANMRDAPAEMVQSARLAASKLKAD